MKTFALARSYYQDIEDDQQGSSIIKDLENKHIALSNYVRMSCVPWGRAGDKNAKK